jgi:hypothetical protein
MKTFALILLLAQVDHYAPDHWYEYDCCGHQDCFPAPKGAIMSVPDGYLVRYGSIHEVRKFSDTSVRPSKDGDNHLCIGTGSQGLFLRCIYIGVGA